MRREKHYLIEAISEPISRHGSFVIMNYEKVDANKINEFRREVSSIGGAVKMARKRILAKACAEVGITIDPDKLPGHIGIVFSGKDAIETAKLVFKFSQDTEKAAQVVGAQIDGKLYDAKDVETLSKLPSRDELRAQLLGTFEAPMAQTLAVMEALLSSVPYCLDNKSKLQDGSSS